MGTESSARKVCGIPSKTLGLCDLEYGHDGDLHESEGDGFYSRQFDKLHRDRQRLASARNGKERG